MRARTLIAVAAALVIGVPAAAHAQGDTTRHANQPPPMMGPPRGGRGPGGMDRARFQRQIRQAFTHAVRTQVGLSDEQMQKVAPINQRFAAQRQSLAREERSVRMSLRDELAKTNPDEARVSQYSDQLEAFPRKRLDLNDAEDKEMAGIMTPVQLARYRALQERVQRQIDSMRPPLGGDARPLPLGDSVQGRPRPTT